MYIYSWLLGKARGTRNKKRVREKEGWKDKKKLVLLVEIELEERESLKQKVNAGGKRMAGERRGRR